MSILEAPNAVAASGVSHRKPRRFLRDFLRVAPLSHAAWRAVEALSLSQIPLKRPILDIGCGFGEFAGVVFGKLDDGIDINGDDLIEAHRTNTYGRLIQCDARQIPLKSQTYPTVISISVLEHIPDAQLALQEAGRVIQPGGVFVIVVPTTEMYEQLLIPEVLRLLGLSGLADWYLRQHRAVFKHITIHPVQWWVDELEGAGFDVVRQEGTLSRGMLRLHELFLLPALPSQITRKVFGKRLLIPTGLRSMTLPYFFTRFIKLDKSSGINMLIVGVRRQSPPS